MKTPGTTQAKAGTRQAAVKNKPVAAGKLLTVIGGVEVEVEVVRKRIRRLNLYVLPPDGRVRISAPQRSGDGAILAFIQSKEFWIQRQIDAVRSKPRPPEPQYVTGEVHLLWGAPLRLEERWAESPAPASAPAAAPTPASKGRRPKVWAEARGEALLLYAPKGSPRELREAAVDRWYRRELLAALPALIETWQEVIGVRANEVRVRNMRTRWGTCSIRPRRVWINIALAQAPPECLEYIVVHELAHLIEPSHNSRFKALMDRYLPDWRVRRKRLNEMNKIYK
ncbi:MAG: M48 family metallopeptidase [Clostridiales bacterium]|nr:M48 family metallopeptidase [Clostridiales bacterium]